MAFANYQNGLAYPVLSTVYQTSGVRSSSCRKRDKPLARAFGSSYAERDPGSAEIPAAHMDTVKQ
jgi:hypothetical protein